MNLRTTAGIVTLTMAVGGLVGSTVLAANAAPTARAQAAVAPCTSIGARLGGAQGAAGSTYQTLRLRNTSHVTCTLDGYPTVAYVNIHKRMIGWPAKPEATRHPRTVTLRPGAVAKAVLQIPDPGDFSPVDCLAHNANKIRVGTGHDRTPSYITWNRSECTTKFARSFIMAIHR
ncbi:MAG: DUF4232 domain-containing protein [Nocardioidaceae bacterium]